MAIDPDSLFWDFTRSEPKYDEYHANENPEISLEERERILNKLRKKYGDETTTTD